MIQLRKIVFLESDKSRFVEENKIEKSYKINGLS